MRPDHEERSEKYHEAYANFLALAFMPSLPALMLLAASTAASLLYRVVSRFWQ